MDFGLKLRAARELKNMKQSELAEAIGVKKNTVISNWENNVSRPNIDQISNLCFVLDVSPDYFFDLPQQKSPPDTEPPVSEEEKKEMAIKFYRWLIDTGKIKPGEDLNPQQISALIGIFDIIDAIF